MKRKRTYPRRIQRAFDRLDLVQSALVVTDAEAKEILCDVDRLCKRISRINDRLVSARWRLERRLAKACRIYLAGWPDQIPAKDEVAP